MARCFVLVMFSWMRCSTRFESEIGFGMRCMTMSAFSRVSFMLIAWASSLHLLLLCRLERGWLVNCDRLCRCSVACCDWLFVGYLEVLDN